MGKVFDLSKHRRAQASVQRSAASPNVDTGDRLRDAPDAALLGSERRFLMTLVLDAVRTYKKFAFSGNRRGQRLFREAEDWFFGGDDTAISFELLSQLVDLDPERIRRHLSSWRATTASRNGGLGLGARRAGPEQVPQPH